MLRQLLTGTLLALVTCAAIAQAPVGVDERARLGREGATLGRQLADSAPSATVETGGEGEAGVLRISGQDSIEVQEVVPGASKAPVDALRAMEGRSLEGMRDAAEEQRRLDDRDPGSYGKAWREVVNARRTDEAATLADGALWRQSTPVLDNAARGIVGNTLTSCVIQQDDGPLAGVFVGRTVERVCEQLHRLDRCTRTREVDIETEANVLVGEYSNPALGGPVTLEGQILASTPITGASLHVAFAPGVTVATIEVAPTVENEFSWRVRLEPAPTACDGAPGCTVNANAAVYADLQRVNSSFASDPDDCLLETDQFCTAEWQCQDSDPRMIGGLLIDANSPLASEPLYPGAQGLCWRADATYNCPLTEGQFCFTDPEGQQVCESTPPGGGRDNTCTALEQDLRCHLVRRRCSEDAQGHGGFCYVESLTYECLLPEGVEDRTVITTNVCNQDIPCMGNACKPADVGREYPGNSWIRTQATLMLAQHFMSDYKIDPLAAASDTQHPERRLAGVRAATGKAVAAVAPSAEIAKAAVAELYPDPAAPVENAPTLAAVTMLGSPGVRFFPGEPEQCAKQLGGLRDCCTDTETSSESLWLGLYQQQLAKSNLKRASNERGIERSDESGYKALARGEASEETLDRGLVSGVDTATGESGGFGSATATSAGDGSMAGLQTQFVAEANRTVRPDLSWGCPKPAFDLAVQKETGSCLNVGSYCKRSVFGACLDKRDTYCCFSSPLSKAVRLHLAGGQQGVEQGAFGTAREPQCAGVPLESLTEGQWENLDLTDAIARLNLASMFPHDETQRRAKTTIARTTGGGSSVGDTQREDSETRARRRVASFDPTSVRRSVEEQQRALMPGAIAEPESPGKLSIVPGWQVVTQGERAAVAVARAGNAGAVSVAYRVYSDGGRDDARPGIDFTPVSGRLTWADGDDKEKSIVVTTLNGENAGRAEGSKRTLRIALSEPAGGASLGEIPIAKILLNWQGAAPRPVAYNNLNLDVSKRFAGSTTGPAGRFADWRIDIVNAGTTRIFDLLFIDYLPFNEDYVSVSGIPGDDSYTRLCRPGTGGPSEDGGHRAVCLLNFNVAMLPGEHLSFIVRGRVRAGGVHRNTCSVSAGGLGTDGVVYRTYVTPFVCLADALVEAPPSGTGNFPPCPSRPPPVGLAPGAASANPFSAPPSTWVTVTQPRSTYVAIPFLAGSGQLLRMRRTSGTFASASAITISDCPGDLARAVADPPYATGGVECRFHDALGTVPRALRIGGAGGCRLEPGNTYFLNIAHASFDANGATDTCTVGNACGVDLEIADVP